MTAPPLKMDPQFGYFPWWPEDGDGWVHPEDVAIARSLIPSERVFCRDGEAGEPGLDRGEPTVARFHLRDVPHLGEDPHLPRRMPFERALGVMERNESIAPSVDDEHGTADRVDDPSRRLRPSSERHQRARRLEERGRGIRVLAVALEHLDVQPDQLGIDRGRIRGDHPQPQSNRAFGLETRDSLTRCPLADARQLVHAEAEHHDRRRVGAAHPREDGVREHKPLDGGGLKCGLEHRDPAAHGVPAQDDRRTGGDPGDDSRQQRAVVRDSAAAPRARRVSESGEIEREHPAVSCESLGDRKPRQERTAQTLDEWLLQVVESPSASGARGLVQARFYTRDGQLVASCAQEGLIRQRKQQL